MYLHDGFTDGSTTVPIDATFLNGIIGKVSAFDMTQIKKATFNSSSTANVYNVTVSWTPTGAQTAPSGNDLPMLFMFTPTLTNAANATINMQWNTYFMYDIFTGDKVTAGQFRANVPSVCVLAGQKVWTLGVCAIDEAISLIQSHASNTSNPHSVTATQVGATPASHASDTSNPHNVTATQVGALTDTLTYAGSIDRTSGSSLVLTSISDYKGIFLQLVVTGGGSTTTYQGFERIPKEIVTNTALGNWQGCITADGDIKYRYTISNGNTITYVSTGSGHTYVLKIYYYN